MSDTRPIWLTQAQRDALGMMLNTAEAYGTAQATSDVSWAALNQWDAAPQDATEAIKAAIYAYDREGAAIYTRAVLAALKHPAATP